VEERVLYCKRCRKRTIHRREGSRFVYRCTECNSPTSGTGLVLITIHIPATLLEELDKLIEAGRLPNRSEAIRYALRQFIIEEKKGMEGEIEFISG